MYCTQACADPPYGVTFVSLTIFMASTISTWSRSTGGIEHVFTKIDLIKGIITTPTTQSISV